MKKKNSKQSEIIIMIFLVKWEEIFEGSHSMVYSTWIFLCLLNEKRIISEFILINKAKNYWSMNEFLRRKKILYFLNSSSGERPIKLNYSISEIIIYVQWESKNIIVDL